MVETTKTYQRIWEQKRLPDHRSRATRTLLTPDYQSTKIHLIHLETHKWTGFREFVRHRGRRLFWFSDNDDVPRKKIFSRQEPRFLNSFTADSLTHSSRRFALQCKLPRNGIILYSSESIVFKYLHGGWIDEFRLCSGSRGEDVVIIKHHLPD